MRCAAIQRSGCVYFKTYNLNEITYTCALFLCLAPGRAGYPPENNQDLDLETGCPLSQDSRSEIHHE